MVLRKKALLKSKSIFDITTLERKNAERLNAAKEAERLNAKRNAERLNAEKNAEKLKAIKNIESLKFVDRLATKNHLLIYDDVFLNLLRANKNLQRDVLQIVSQKKVNRIATNKYSINRITDSVKPAGNTLSNAFELRFFENFKTVKKFFLKEVSNPDFIFKNRGGINEMLGLKLLEKHGFNIIKPHFASYITSNKRPLKTFVLLEYTDLITSHKALSNKLISKKQYDILDDKLYRIHNEMKAKGIALWDLSPENIFIDISKKPYKLYISDPIFELPLSSSYIKGVVDSLNK